MRPTSYPVILIIPPTALATRSYAGLECRPPKPEIEQ